MAVLVPQVIDQVRREPPAPGPITSAAVSSSVRTLASR